MLLLGAALSRLGLRTMNHAEARRLDVLVVHALPASVCPTVSDSETETESESETESETETESESETETETESESETETESESETESATGLRAS